MIHQFSRSILLAATVAALAGFAAPRAAASDPAKVLRLALPDIAMLDLQQITDLYSGRVASAIFEGLYQFDYLATPARVVPNTAVALPEITACGRHRVGGRRVRRRCRHDEERRPASHHGDRRMTMSTVPA